MEANNGVGGARWGMGLGGEAYGDQALEDGCMDRTLLGRH